MDGEMMFSRCEKKAYKRLTRATNSNPTYQAEEEEYATRFIHFFSTGLLSIPDGKTLRSSLAEKLSCDPMRITKKFGMRCQVFLAINKSYV